MYPKIMMVQHAGHGPHMSYLVPVRPSYWRRQSGIASESRGRHSTLIDPQSRSDERNTHFGPCNVATSQLASLKRPDLT